MKQTRVTRRDFFKLTAFGAGTVAASRHPQPTFNPIASTTIFGAPTGLSAG